MAEENVSRSCGSDVVFDFFCELCFDDNKQVEAEGFCVDCGEYLCGSCYHGHRKSRLTRHHVLQDQENMAKDTPLSVNRVIKDITTKCKLHRSEIVKYYCRDHNVLVCSTCFFEAHRGCSGVESILDVSVNLLKNQELINFLDQLKSMQKKTSDTLAHARENKTVSERCYADVVSSVRRLKEETIEKLNEAEQNIIALAVQMKKEDEGKMKSVEMDCEAMSGKLEQMSTDVESLHISKRVCQLYISMRQLNGEVMELQKSMENLGENIVVRTFRFEPNPEFPSVLRNPEVLGKISTQHKHPLMIIAIADEAPRTTTGSHGADTKILPCPEYQHASVSQGAESSSVVDPSKRDASDLIIPKGLYPPQLRMGIPPQVPQDQDKVPTQPRKIKALSRDLPLEERLTDFLTAISTPDEQSFVKTLDVAAFNAALTLSIVYKAKHKNHLKPAMECDLFLEDIWITYHAGSTKEDCMVDVYHKAWKILSTKTAKDVLAIKRKISEHDLFGPYMITVYRKGVGNSVDSNATHLKRYGHDLSTTANNRLEDIVLLEHNEWSSDRQKHAVDIVNLSCMQNGLLLQWETETLLNTYSTVNARCQVYINRQKMGDSYGVGKAQAKELAFKEALYKLYEKQPVIRMNLDGDVKEWITYELLTKEADDLKNRGLKANLPLRDETGTPISSYITKVAYEKVKRFAQKKKGEIIFAPGMTSDEGKEVCYIGRMLNLKCDMRAHEGQQYIVLFKHIEWSKLVSRLSPTAGLYGKYFRVAKEDVPKFAVVAKQILKQPHTNMDDYLAAGDGQEPIDIGMGNGK